MGLWQRGEELYYHTSILGFSLSLTSTLFPPSAHYSYKIGNKNRTKQKVMSRHTDDFGIVQPRPERRAFPFFYKKKKAKHPVDEWDLKRETAAWE